MIELSRVGAERARIGAIILACVAVACTVLLAVFGGGRGPLHVFLLSMIVVSMGVLAGCMVALGRARRKGEPM